MITIDKLRSICPAAFASAPHASRSGKYSFFSTADLLPKFEREGWYVTGAKQSRTRSESREGFQRHLVKLAHVDYLGAGARIVGEERPEVILINSHDGGSCYIVEGGIFRLACANGLVVSTASMGSARLRHSHASPDDVIAASIDIAAHTANALGTVEEMKKRELTPSEMMHLAEQGIALRWASSSPSESPLTPSIILGNVRRREDEGASLWSVFNRIQENLTQGGLSDPSRLTATGRKRRTRPLAEINASTAFNKALWHEAELTLAS